MVYLLALAAALANALTSVLQRIGVEDAPREHALRLSLIRHAIRKRVWLAGFGLMLCSFVAQAAALHKGRLSEVQPILTVELLFLVVILSFWFRYELSLRDIIGVGLFVLGLAGFLIFAAPVGGHAHPSATEWIAVGVSCAGVVALCVVGAQRGPRWWRAAMYGAGAAISFAFTASCTKVVADIVSVNAVSIFWHWETYALAGAGSMAVFLTQNAFHSGPIAASQSTLVLIDPLASILIGVFLFGDDLRTSGAWGPLEALSLLVLFVGAVLLSASPLVAGARSENTGEFERLAHRARHRRNAPAN
jgi:drug/metabolite transporter (DMT)-like permease